MKYRKDLLKRIENVSTVPTIPTVLERITLLLQNPQTSAEEIGRAITTDQSLASKVLKLVNSAFYGFPGRISTITHAVVILGFATIKNLVLTTTIFEVFKNKQSAENFDMERFWFHSVACGAAAKSLAGFVGCNEREECFIAGLLHDIGKIIICRYLPDEFEQTTDYVQKNDSLFLDAEEKLFSNTHQQIGGFLAESWNLPRSLQYPILYHHRPHNAKRFYTIVAIVHVADILIRSMDFGNGGDKKIPQISHQVWENLGLDRLSLPQVLDSISDEVEKATVFMQI